MKTNDGIDCMENKLLPPHSLEFITYFPRNRLETTKVIIIRLSMRV